ncbi:hypothetical protein GYMLUDRAFT_504090, partial [Collybiopsis luxurians FD-317 M1]
MLHCIQTAVSVLRVIEFWTFRYSGGKATLQRPMIMISFTAWIVWPLLVAITVAKLRYNAL